jgi:uncharacterized protein YdhG (YjbR/CyaY superfamily)
MSLATSSVRAPFTVSVAVDVPSSFAALASRSSSKYSDVFFTRKEYTLFDHLATGNPWRQQERSDDSGNMAIPHPVLPLRYRCLKATEVKRMKPTTADEYVATFPTEIQHALKRLREAIYDTIPQATEKIRYAMPAVMLDGHYVVHYAAWKNHIGLYPIPPLSADLELKVAPLRSTKDTVHLAHGTPIPTDLIRRLVTELVQLRASITGQDTTQG